MDMERYYAFDEIGILGVQKKMSKRAIEKQSRETGEIIRKYREAQKKANSSSPAKTQKRKKK